jgi:repressor LexA
MTTVGQRLKAEREKRGWTQAQLSDMLNIKIGTLSGYERDYRQPDLEMLQKLASAFNVSTDYLLGRTDAKNSSPVSAKAEPADPTQSVRDLLAKPLADLLEITKVPLVGRIRAGMPMLAAANIEGEVVVPTGLGAEFALKVRGDSMIGAGIYEGDVAICRGTDDKPAAHGDIVVALVNGDEATLKYLINDSGTWTLRAANPQYPDIILPVDHIIQGVVVLIQKAPPALERVQSVERPVVSPGRIDPKLADVIEGWDEASDNDKATLTRLYHEFVAKVERKKLERGETETKDQPKRARNTL